MVHIDFGIVFEQGKTLSTPETVPFRLTRDMVDGLGITGTEGRFRQACEVAMHTLRLPNNAAALVTLAEVFIHDPLYRWMLSPVQAMKHQRRQEDDEEDEEDDGRGGRGGRGSRAGRGYRDRPSAGGDHEGTTGEGGERHESGAAERTLLRIKEKLSGFEDANDSAMSVQGQVRVLIAEATSPEQLCKLFHGWAPWL